MRAERANPITQLGGLVPVGISRGKREVEAGTITNQQLFRKLCRCTAWIKSPGDEPITFQR